MIFKKRNTLIDDEEEISIYFKIFDFMYVIRCLMGIIVTDPLQNQGDLWAFYYYLILMGLDFFLLFIAYKTRFIPHIS